MKYSLKKETMRQLRDTFGLTDYRPGQKAAVQALLSGRDVMCILPTGAGKSLCWQLPAVVHAGLTVVVSPLIALMRDQVQHLAALGIPAVSLDSLMSPEEKAQAMSAIRRGDVRIVLVSPERLQQSSFRRLCKEVPPWLVVVDEAHCIVQWGGDFRPSYQQIGDFLRCLSKRPVLCALTATADKAIQRAVMRQLSAPKMKRLILPHIRENLVYDVRTTLDRWGDILRMCQGAPCKTAIFCPSRIAAERLAQSLRDCGVSAGFYHAGMAREDRMAMQESFRAGDIAVLCATSAFGMGVDIQDIRRVIHAHLPADLIDYVQQSGRAGRDGQRAECIMLLEPNDLVIKARSRAKVKDGWLKPILQRIAKQQSWRKLEKLLTVLFASPCIVSGMAKALGQRVSPCGYCSACRKGQSLAHIPHFTGMTDWQLRLWFLRWQRDKMAQIKDCRPGEILSDEALNMAAKRLSLPSETDAPPEFERLMAYFRGERMQDDSQERIG